MCSDVIYIPCYRMHGNAHAMVGPLTALVLAWV